MWVILAYLCHTAWQAELMRSRQCRCSPHQTLGSAPWRRRWQLWGKHRRSRWWQSSQPILPIPSRHLVPSPQVACRPPLLLPWCSVLAVLRSVAVNTVVQNRFLMCSCFTSNHMFSLTGICRWRIFLLITLLSYIFVSYTSYILLLHFFHNQFCVVIFFYFHSFIFFAVWYYFYYSWLLLLQQRSHFKLYNKPWPSLLATNFIDLLCDYMWLYVTIKLKLI